MVVWNPNDGRHAVRPEDCQIKFCFRVVTFVIAVDQHGVKASLGEHVGGVKGLGVVVERFDLAREKKSVSQLAAGEVAEVLDG